MTHLPFKLGYLTPEMVEKAKNELGETEAVRKESLMELRKLLKEETKLICPDDEVYLTQFLRARKYNVKRTLSLLLNYYNTKKHRPEVYSHDFYGFRNSIINKIFYILPKRDHDGTAILIFKLEHWDLNERKLASLMHDITIAALFMIEDPATQVCGMKAIFDMTSLSFSYLKAFHPKYLHLLASGAKNGLPFRLKEVHIINESHIFQYIWSVIKYLINEKIRNRIRFHTNDRETLHKYLSPEILPLEYGGNVDYDAQRVLKFVDSKRDLYDKLLSYGYKSRRASQERTLGN